jgi:hypothetical protein
MDANLEPYEKNLKPFMSDAAMPAPSKGAINNIISTNNIRERKEFVRSDIKTPYKALQDLQFLTDNRRKNDLSRIAKALAKCGFLKDEIEQTIAIIDSSPIPSVETLELPEHIAAIIEHATKRERNLADEFRTWVTLQEGYWNLTEAKQALQILTKEEKAHLDVIIHRLKKDGLIEKYGKQAGVYRRVDIELEAIDFLNASSDALDLQWPFDIQNYVKIHPGAIIGGAGESNSGKTAYALNCARLWQDKFDVHYFSSEMGRTELRERLSKFPHPLESWRVHFWERSCNFADVIRPDGINIIDFLEIHDEFYKVGLYIKEIFDKLKSGIAFILIQKNKNTDFGLGGMRSLEKARLYLAMEPGRLKIVKAKNWARQENPNGLAIDFKLAQGCKFIKESEWRRIN